MRWVGVIVAPLLVVRPVGAEALRPPISGVSHIALYATDTLKAQRYYEHDLGGIRGPDPERSDGARYYFAPTQFVEVLPLPSGEQTANRLDHVAYVTPDVEAMRQYLASRGVAVPKQVSQGRDQSRWFVVIDPENHHIEFVQPPPKPPAVPVNSLSHHMLHVGFVVRDPVLEDSFFVNLLGFHAYWQGGFRPDKPLWIWRQLPESRDWVEYMIADDSPGGSNLPDAVGAMNHFALGVANVEASYTYLWNNARVSEHHNNPMLGHSAKWEFSLFDPDGTRTELEEFHAVGKPCCSPVTGAEPEE